MPTNYLSNRYLLKEIHKSKIRFCSFVDADAATYHHISPADVSLDDLTAQVRTSPEHYRTGQIIRVMTNEHIPPLAEPRRASRAKNRHLPDLPFPAFKHFRIGDVQADVQLTEVLRSHWVGGFSNGHFEARTARMTDALARSCSLMVDRIATKPNFSGYSFIEEMKSESLVNLMHVALKFDESRSQNPFAYWTSCVTNSFVRILNKEKRQRDIRDGLLLAMDANPSITSQDHDLQTAGTLGWTELEQHQKKIRRGRPPKNR